MSIEKLSLEKINTIIGYKTDDRHDRWRNLERNFADFTAIKTLDNVNFHSAELNYSDFHGIAFKNVDFGRAELRYTNFGDCSFENCRFDGCDGEFCNFHGAMLKSCYLDGSFIFANFRGCKFSSCAFDSANLLFADLVSAEYEDCEGMNIRNFTMAHLGESLDGLTYDTEQYPNI